MLKQNRRMHFMMPDGNQSKTAFCDKHYGLTERHSLLKSQSKSHFVESRMLTTEREPVL